MAKKFIRQESVRYSKLGKNRRKLQKWRRPKGRDSKMRLKRRNYSGSPTVGHKTSKKEYGKVDGLKPILVHNIKELNQVGKGSIALLARVGAKKKLEMIAEAEKNKIRILNVSAENKK